VALGLLAAAIGAYGAIRRRDWSLVAMGASAVLVYAGARAFASIYVEAKALAVMSPLVVMAALHGLLSPRVRGGGSSGQAEGSSHRAVERAAEVATGSDPSDPARPLGTARVGFGVIVAIAFAASTFLALRAAPIGFDQRGNELGSLGGLIQGRTVAFLGVDRFAGYWLRGTLMRSPGGYVPSEVRARPKKVWQQGLAMDFDTLPPVRLDQFRYVITTRAGYQSTPPPNFRRVARTASYDLWKRAGPTPPLHVIDKDGTPGAVLDCASAEGRRIEAHSGTATVLPEPVVNRVGAWSRGSPFDAPGTATQKLRLRPGPWALSLQYHSQVPLTVSAPGLHTDLPPSLDGMYLTHQAQGAFWSAGILDATRGGPVTVTVSAKKPTRFQRALGVRRQVWLGPLAATRPGSTQVPLADACGRFVDHFTVRPRH
jgi:hypothetical protein